jgi:hypothetical protein
VVVTLPGDELTHPVAVMLRLAVASYSPSIPSAERDTMLPASFGAAYAVSPPVVFGALGIEPEVEVGVHVPRVHRVGHREPDLLLRAV